MPSSENRQLVRKPDLDLNGSEAAVCSSSQGDKQELWITWSKYIKLKETMGNGPQKPGFKFFILSLIICVILGSLLKLSEA